MCWPLFILHRQGSLLRRSGDLLYGPGGPQCGSCIHSVYPVVWILARAPVSITWPPGSYIGLSDPRISQREPVYQSVGVMRLPEGLLCQ